MRNRARRSRFALPQEGGRAALDRVGWTVRVLIAGVAVLAGCAQCRLPRIDPSGQHFFTQDSPTSPAAQGGAPASAAATTPQPGAATTPSGPPTATAGVPQGRHPWSPIELQVAPGSSIAPVGSEIVLVAGVRDGDDYLRTNERVEWSIMPGSVGEFVDFDPGSICDVFWGDFTWPKKVNNTYVVGSTSRSNLRLTRGTPVLEDDVTVHSGQTWVTVSSRSEGTTYVTAFTPSVENWNFRKRTAVIHWVDAQWRFPTPTVAPAGTRQTLTTQVMRHTDQAPAAGWHVVYTVIGGTPAGFAPSGASSIEVETNASGNATVELIPSQATAGVTQVSIQIVRAVASGGVAAARLPIAVGATSVSWSAPGVSVRKTGPAVAAVGSTVTYRIEASNTGSMVAENVTISDEIPEAMTYLSSTPAGDPGGRTVQWPIGRLTPGECRYVEVSLRADRTGTFTSYAEASTAGGLRSRGGITTTVATTLPTPAATPPIGTMPSGTMPGGATVPPAAAWPSTQTGDLRLALTGPPRAIVGDKVKFTITLANVGRMPLRGIVIEDAFEAGFSHPNARNAIRRVMPEAIEPGKSAPPIEVELTVTAAGRLCHTVTATADSGAKASAQACVLAEEGLGAGPTSAASGNVTLVVSVKPVAPVVGGTVEFRIEVTNTGTQTLSDVVVRNRFDPALFPVGVTKDEQYTLERDDIIAWRIGQLTPNQPQRLTIGCECRRATPRAGLLVGVSTAAGVLAQQSKDIEILSVEAAQPGGLRMHITTLHEPVRVGDRLTYVIDIENTGSTAQRDVALTVTVPDEMVVERISTRGPSTPQIDKNVVQFGKLEQVAVGETITYYVGVKAGRAGAVQVAAQLSTRSSAEPITMSRSTTILASDPETR